MSTNKKNDTKKVETKKIKVLEESEEFIMLAEQCLKYDKLMPSIKNMSYICKNKENTPLVLMKRYKNNAMLRMEEIANKMGIVSRKDIYREQVRNKIVSGEKAEADKQETFTPKSSGGSE